MIVQIMLIIGGVSAVVLSLALTIYAIDILPTPPAQHVTVPIEDAREHLPR